MKLFLVSSLNNYEKSENGYIVKPIDNINGLVDKLKSSIEKTDVFTYVVSDPTGYDKTDLYSNILIESLKMDNIVFNEYYVIDNRFKGNIESLIKRSDVIYIAGGDTLQQMEYLNKINLRELLKDYNGVIIGQSAGAINLAENVFNSPECKEDLEKTKTYIGLGKTNINVEPHFVYSDESFDEDEKLQRKEVLKESENRVLYGLCDNSFIFEENNKTEIYGECYKIYNHNITRIQ